MIQAGCINQSLLDYYKRKGKDDTEQLALCYFKKFQIQL
jgi:hypothetical protein